MVYLKFQIVCIQEREELRALEREKTMSREDKIKRKVCVWKTKKNRKEIKKNKYMYERMTERKKEKRGVARKI
jgi:hypothetical protein